MFTTRRALSWLMACLLIAAPAMAASRGEVVAKLEDFRMYFADFQQAPDRAIPADLLAECYGVIIMRQYKAGFVVGAKIGHGVILMHDRYSGEWSAPAFVRAAEGSVGFQIGGQSVDAIILIMNQAGVDMLLKTRFTLGVDASAAAGPVGRDMSADVGLGTALLTYSRAKGLFAGASFEGGGWLNNNDYNLALYGQSVGLRDILLDRVVPIPAEAGPMIATLNSYSSASVPAPVYDYAQPTGAPPPRIGSVAPQPNTGYADPYAAPAPNYGYAPAPQAGNQAYLDEEARRAADAARQAAEAARYAAQEADEAARRASRGY